MGKKRGWFAAVKKALSHNSKGKSAQRSRKSKKRNNLNASPSAERTEVANLVLPPPEEIVQLAEAKYERSEPPGEEQIEPAVDAQTRPTVNEHTIYACNEQTKHAYSVAIASAKAAEAAAAAAQAAAEVVRLTAIPRTAGNSREEISAVKIQTAFRVFKARRTLQTMRGMVRLKILVQGSSVKRQSKNTLRTMQTLSRVQSQIRSRRIRLSEENRFLQQHLQRKREKELRKLKESLEGEWDGSTKSKEQVVAKLTKREEAAVKRERALAYAHAQQQKWRKSLNSPKATFMDPNAPNWGWSWLERWMAARPWEAQSAMRSNDHASVKTTTKHATSVSGSSKASNSRVSSTMGSIKARTTRTAPVKNFGKAPATNNVKSSNKPSLTAKKVVQNPGRKNPSATTYKAPSVSSVNATKKPASLNRGGRTADHDTRSSHSVQSCGHSIAGSLAGDNESLASCSSVPSYMAPTKATEARSRLPSRLGMSNGTPDRSSVGSGKRLSYPASPAGSRRNSGPPSVDGSSVKSTGNSMPWKCYN